MSRICVAEICDCVNERIPCMERFEPDKVSVARLPWLTSAVNQRWRDAGNLVAFCTME